MATGKTGFTDVGFDLVALQYRSLKSGHDYGQYVRDAKNAGLHDVASFFEEVTDQESKRAERCHELQQKVQSGVPSPSQRSALYRGAGFAGPSSRENPERACTDGVPRVNQLVPQRGRNWQVCM